MSELIAILIIMFIVLIFRGLFSLLKKSPLSFILILLGLSLFDDDDCDCDI